MANGWKWYDDKTEKMYRGPEYKVHESIKDVPDNICKKILICEVIGKPYKIIPAELKFYKRLKLPVPRKCPNQRHKGRMALRNPRRLWERQCMKCGAGIKTPYSPDRPEKIYCEKCYLGEVY